MEDKDIVELYWRRDESAVERSQEKYGAYCLAIARRIVPDAADEAFNDALLGAWNAMPPHRPAELSTFLGKLTRRAALKLRRSASAEKRGGDSVTLALEELDECLPGGADPVRALEGKELADLLNDFLRALKPAERRAFVLRYWYLEPISDVARQLGWGESRVKSLLFRLRKRLAARLDAYEKEESP